MQSFLEGIINKKQVAILIDPEKIQSIDQLDYLVRKIEFSKASYIFVGGSTVNPLDFSDVISRIKSTTSIPVIIFPGSSNQVSNDADGILLLNLISGRNPDFLITHHVQAAEFLDKSNLEIISTSYLLIDGGSQSSVAYVSQTTPIPHHNHSIVYKTALAGKQIGHKVIFLDAGSGAQNAVQPDLVQTLVKLGQPIIVGGGIRSLEQIKNLHDAGANLVVIGNKIEEDIDFLLEIHSYSNNLMI
ncbi:MAG TPA: phosphoglycerol geranylgeranyltransferase [Taishania sp.]|nr:phosphoglycerol geranylgeranyltransferase [Taishania sp.]